MIFGAILAGGTGSRMNIADRPKQFLPLGEKPMVLHTLEKFLVCSRFDKVYVGVHPDWLLYMGDLVEKQLRAHTDRIVLVEGGADRNETIMNIIRDIESCFGESDEHIIVTHDAVRPFVTLRMIEENIDAALAVGACDTVVPAVDTIVESVTGEVISHIPDRSVLYQGQTPQSFNISLLKRLYASLDDSEKEMMTDACKICIVRNAPVKLVMGEVSNLKITTMGDYQIAQAMLGGLDID